MADGDRLTRLDTKKIARNVTKDYVVVTSYTEGFSPSAIAKTATKAVVQENTGRKA